MKTMRCLIILLSLSACGSALGQESLRWYPSASRFPEGECVRLHSPSGGDSYVEKVKTEECRPEKITFLWKDGQCFEVDADGAGRGYGLRLKSPAPCAPQGSLFSFDEKKRECWLIDPSGGLSFRAKVELDECRPLPENLTKKFHPDASGVGGDCLEVHVTQGSARWARKLNPAECRPAVTRFSWRMTGPFKGECWELAQDGPNAYSSKVGSQRCRPESVVYVFERTGERRGDCYEVDAETRGQNWAQKVAPSSCRSED